MTDWIEHTTGTCPVDPETVVEGRVKHGASIIDWSPPRPARRFRWADPCITHYRIVTPAKPPEPDMPKTAQERAAAMVAATKPEPDLITLRLECLKMAVGMLDRLTFREGSTVADAADDLLHYVLNGSVDKA